MKKVLCIPLLAMLILSTMLIAVPIRYEDERSVTFNPSDVVRVVHVKSSDATGTEKDNFLENENVYAIIKTTGTGTIEVRIYVVNNQAWENRASMSDVSGGYETVTLTATKSPLTHGPFLIWPAPPTVGGYDIVVDENQNGIRDRDERVDSSDPPPGFTVSAPPPPPEATISGVKFHDRNGNGDRDAGEEGLDGWTIQLWREKPDGDWELVGTTETTDEGNYIFTVTVAGTYRVMENENLKPGWKQTAPASGYHEIEVELGETYSSNDFGNFKLGVKGGYKWNDLNGDGDWDTGEPALDGWTIELYKLVGEEWEKQGEVLTGADDWADGYYEFAGLTAGDYKVKELVKDGWVQTSSPDEYTFTVTSGFESLNNNFGNFKLAVVEGYKWEDRDGDGVWDKGEPALRGWTIKATKDAVIRVTTTDANGYYKFTFGPEDAGLWTISEVLQKCWRQTYPSPPGTYTVDIFSGATYSGRNFGNAKRVTRTWRFWAIHYKLW